MVLTNFSCLKLVIKIDEVSIDNLDEIMVISTSNRRNPIKLINLIRIILVIEKAKGSFGAKEAT